MYLSSLWTSGGHKPRCFATPAHVYLIATHLYIHYRPIYTYYTHLIVIQITYIKNYILSFIMRISIAPLQGDYPGVLSIPARLKRKALGEHKRVRGPYGTSAVRLP